MGKKRKRADIGTMGERSLHAALKKWYAQPGDRLEVEVEGYLVDVVRGDLLIEIQTGSFSSIKAKLLALTECHAVRLVHPLAREKWIVYLAEDGLTETGRRKSPQHLGLVHVFKRLVSIPEVMARESFSLEVLVTQEEEIRRELPRRSSGRRRTSKFDRRLLCVEGRKIYETPADLRAFLPEHLTQPFTTGDLAEAIGEPRWLAEKITYCLRRMDVIRTVGKRRNALLYSA